jgi:transposase
MKTQQVTIKNAQDIGGRLRGEKGEEVKIKLIFLNLIANLKIDLEKVCEIFAIATSTGYLWIGQWNQEGYEGIKGKENKGQGE